MKINQGKEKIQIKKETEKVGAQQISTGKAIIFDSGTLISFTMNGMSETLKRLKGIFKGKFLITGDVKREIIDVPLKIKRFELEALKIQALLDQKILETPQSLGIDKSEVNSEEDQVMKTANSAFNGKGRDIHIVDLGEASCVALSRILTKKGIKNVIALDERTTRLLSERPEGLREIFQHRMNTRINMRKQNTDFFRSLKFIRSTELAYVAYKKGLLDWKGPDVLDALLYAMKFKGAAISGDEIKEIERMK